MPISFELRLSGDLEEVLLRRGGPVDEYTEAVARRVLALIQLYAPRRSGRLAESYQARRVGLSSWVIWSDLDYAAFVTRGTRPHRIRPRRARALRWYGEAGPVFAAWVDHPGTEPDTFLIDALRDGLGQ